MRGNNFAISALAYHGGDSMEADAPVATERKNAGSVVTQPLPRGEVRMTVQQNQQKKEKKKKPQQIDQQGDKRRGGQKQFHNPKYHPKPGHGGPGDPSGGDQGNYGT